MSHKFKGKMLKKQIDKIQQKRVRKMRHLRPVPFVSFFLEVERKER